MNTAQDALAAAKQPSRLSRGFTLLELSVVLVISSLMLTLAWNLTTQMLALEGRLAEERSRHTRGAMERDWVRGIIQGICTDFPFSRNPVRRFAGDAQKISGFTTGALVDQAGAPREFELLLTQDESATLLQYRERVGDAWSAPQAITRLIGRHIFQFEDDSGQFQRRWPVSLSQPQLPAVVRVIRADASEELFVSARPAMTEVPTRGLTGF